MRPRFAVVIPVRDREEVVGRAVASVLAQTFGEFEVVVVDLGSTDATVEAVRLVADRRVRVVHVEGATPVTAACHCRAEFVAVLDPECVADPSWLARCGQAADRVDADVVVAGAAAMVRRRLYEGADPSWPPSAVVSAARAGGSVVLDELDALVTRRPPPPVPDRDPDARRLAWCHTAIDVLSLSPIPDVELLARLATVGGVAAARLRRRRESRELLLLARRLTSGELRCWARWLVALLPPVSDRVWNPANHAKVAAQHRQRHERAELLGPRPL